MGSEPAFQTEEERLRVRIADLEAENARLRQSVYDARSEGAGFADREHELLEEAARLREDEARLDWLEEQRAEPGWVGVEDGEQWIVSLEGHSPFVIGAGSTLRAAIDAARASDPPTDTESK